MGLKRVVGVAALLGAAVLMGAGQEPAEQLGIKGFRPAAVPLVTSDPFLSIWSEANNLTDDVTRHWTKRAHPLVSLIRVDGKAYRLMGNDPRQGAAGVLGKLPAMKQVGLQVLPTRTIYEFEDANVHVELTFMTPVLPSDLEVMSRPVTYITWTVTSVDGAEHAVSIYDSVGSELPVNTVDQKVEWKKEAMGPLTAMRFGTPEQPYVKRAGDDSRIDWGYAYLAADVQAKSAIGVSTTMLAGFAENGGIPAADDANMPRAVRDETPAMAVAMDLGKVGKDAVSRHVMVAYDEVYAINFFGKKLRPYWRKDGWEATDLLQASEKDYATLTAECAAFDKELMADMAKVGGAKYAQMCALAYRQCWAGNGLAADGNKQPLFFTKENTSNGDIATVDVIFPMDPIWIFLSPTLAKASIQPVMEYGASDRWKFPCSPHDLGTYPVARGTDDGGEAMPVEESGNMLILCDAIAHAEGNAEYASLWWPTLTKWAAYLEQFGLDPEEQLCTDDFMGHLAHNSNLSVKAIVALAAYGDLCKMRGDNVNAERYMKLAKADAAHWVKASNDGDHSRLAFDKPNTWSQKYNLVWDKLLGLNVFPPEVAEKEIAYYKKVMQKYGVPLDSRTKLTKTDWSFWSATMASNPEDWEHLTNPIFEYLMQTSARSPFVDSYVTDNIRSDGMHARPVIGGVFIKMLSDEAIWKKWAARDQAKAGNWAPIPPKPVVTDVIASSRAAGQAWQYTMDAPGDGWMKTDFDDKAWKKGQGVFGGNIAGGVGAQRTLWKSSDLWIRRTVTMPEGVFKNLQFSVYHDEDVEIYINGVLAVRETGYNNSLEVVEMSAGAKAELKPGARVTIAAHCHQTVGGQGLDIGIVDVKDAK